MTDPAPAKTEITNHFSQTFIALRNYNYRLWFFGQLISLVGTWMQTTAQGYLIFELTHNTAYLGYASFAAGIPTLMFTLYGGVISDRVPRRTLLLITQTTMLVLAFILSALVFLNVVQPWMILILAFLLGVANAFDSPARLSFVVEMVKREDMPNAIALNASMFNLATVIGPAVSGLTYAAVGSGWCFFINGLSFIAVIIGLLLMKLKPVPPRPRTASAINEIIEGVHFVTHNDTVLTLLINLGLAGMLGMGLVALLPAWATNVLGGDVTYNGYLLSARGIGSLIAALLLAYFVSRQIKGLLWSIGSFLMPLSMVLFAFMTTLPLSLFAITLAGMGFILMVNATNALIQSQVNDELRGRVMSLYSLVFFGLSPIGSLILGITASWSSEPTVVLVGAILLLLLAVLMHIRKPALRHLK